MSLNLHAKDIVGLSFEVGWVTITYAGHKAEEDCDGPILEDLEFWLSERWFNR